MNKEYLPSVQFWKALKMSMNLVDLQEKYKGVNFALSGVVGEPNYSIIINPGSLDQRAILEVEEIECSTHLK